MAHLAGERGRVRGAVRGRSPSLDITGHYDDGSGGQGSVELRSVMVHMIEEYARHNGHADFLRERIDGRVGQ